VGTIKIKESRTKDPVNPFSVNFSCPVRNPYFRFCVSHTQPLYTPHTNSKLMKETNSTKSRDGSNQSESPAFSLIRKHALKNALDFGRANSNAVMGKVLAEMSEIKTRTSTTYSRVWDKNNPH